MLEVLFWLLVAHAVCDFSLQSDFLMRAKNHRAPVLGVPFYQALGAHALIHAGGVFLVTGLPALAAAELIAHAAIDYAKADGRFGHPGISGAAEHAFAVDQALHVGCKVIWALLWSGARAS